MIDGMNIPWVRQAYDRCVEEGRITPGELIDGGDGEWVVYRYLL